MGFFDVVNVYGLLIALALLTPQIIYLKTHKYNRKEIPNRAMAYIDRAGWFCSLFLMAFNVGVLEQGFPEPKELMKIFWMVTTGVLTLVYLLLWVFIFKKRSKGIVLALVLVSAFIFIFSGIVQVKTLLLTAGIVYLIGELYMFTLFLKE